MESDRTRPLCTYVERPARSELRGVSYQLVYRWVGLGVRDRGRDRPADVVRVAQYDVFQELVADLFERWPALAVPARDLRQEGVDLFAPGKQLVVQRFGLGKAILLDAERRREVCPLREGSG